MSQGVLIIYTGGTIGSMPKDPNDLLSPQVVVPGEQFKELTPGMSTFPFPIDFWSFEKPMDSCNIGPREWQMIAQKISDEYDNYTGFVILHGTDTMVYTASALSFMLANLGKPVVLTGAQRAHLFQSRNDALQNILTAIEIANPAAMGHPLIPEVMIMFGQDLLRGNRARKRDANGYAAYETPKYPRLAKIGANIEVDETRILKVPERTFYLRKSLEAHVITFDVFPGIVESGFVKKLLEDPELKGAIVKAYGAGNIQTMPEFLESFEKAAKTGVFLLDVTQCTEGRVELGLYETSNLLLAFGMASGTDLTPEAALCKLMVALGDEDINTDPAALREYMQTNQAGEQSTSIFEPSYRLAKPGLISTQSKVYRLAPTGPVGGDWTPDRLESAMLRVKGAQVITEKSLTIDLYANLSSNEDPAGPSSPKYAGTYRRAPTGDDKTIISFDVTAAARRLLAPGERAPFTLVLSEGEGTMSWDGAELALFVKQ